VETVAGNYVTIRLSCQLRISTCTFNGTFLSTTRRSVFNDTHCE